MPAWKAAINHYWIHSISEVFITFLNLENQCHRILNFFEAGVTLWNDTDRITGADQFHTSMYTWEHAEQKFVLLKFQHVIPKLSFCLLKSSEFFSQYPEQVIWHSSYKPRSLFQFTTYTGKNAVQPNKEKEVQPWAVFALLSLGDFSPECHLSHSTRVCPHLFHLVLCQFSSLAGFRMTNQHAHTICKIFTALVSSYVSTMCKLVERFYFPSGNVFRIFIPLIL